MTTDIGWEALDRLLLEPEARWEYAVEARAYEPDGSLGRWVLIASCERAVEARAVVASAKALPFSYGAVRAITRMVTVTPWEPLDD